MKSVSTADAERKHWDSVSLDDPVTMIRDGDWSVNTPADLAMVDVGSNGPILDLGCGIGRLSVTYARAHKTNVIGVDVSPLMLNRAASDPRVEYLPCDGRTLPRLPKLGGAFSMLMFQHIPHEAQASYVAQVADRLRPGARFRFQTVTGSDDCFLSHQTEANLPTRWCTDAGLKVEEVTLGGGWPEWQWITARK